MGPALFFGGGGGGASSSSFCSANISTEASEPDTLAVGGKNRPVEGRGGFNMVYGTREWHWANIMLIHDAHPPAARLAVIEEQTSICFGAVESRETKNV